MNKKVLYWSDVEELVANVVHQIQEKDIEFMHIVTLARGGYVPAALLGHGLNIRSVHSVCAYSYQGSQRGDITLEGDCPKLDDSKMLIVDDLVDSGETIKFMRQKYPRAKVAVLVAKPNGEGQADFYAEKAEQDCWIDFPWEKN